jgi:hypothetical protein
MIFIQRLVGIVYCSIFVVGIEVLRSEVDYGPLTKIVPTLYKETDPETIVITVDDDKIYKPQTIRSVSCSGSFFFRIFPFYSSRLSHFVTTIGVITCHFVSFCVMWYPLVLFGIIRYDLVLFGVIWCHFVF